MGKEKIQNSSSNMFKVLLEESELYDITVIEHKDRGKNTENINR